MRVAAGVEHREAAVLVGEIDEWLDARHEEIVEGLRREEPTALVAAVLAEREDVDRAPRGLQRAAAVLVVVLDAVVDDRDAHRIVRHDVHQHALHPASARDAVDYVRDARASEDHSVLAQRLGPFAQGGVVVVVGIRPRVSLDLIDAVHVGERKLSRLGIGAALIVLVRVPGAEDVVAVGPARQARPGAALCGVGSADMPQVNPERLEDVAVAEVRLQRRANLRREVDLQRHAIGLLMAAGGEDAFFRGHGCSFALSYRYARPCLPTCSIAPTSRRV